MYQNDPKPHLLKIIIDFSKLYQFQKHMSKLNNKIKKGNKKSSKSHNKKNDKKNEDERINFILLKKIGKTTMPNKFKISIDKLKKYSKIISQI